MAKNVVVNFKNYTDIAIDRSWIRSENFQFRLIDLEFVLRDALTKYPAQMNTPIAFSCSIKEIVSGYIDADKQKLHEVVNWDCSGSIVPKDGETIPILSTSPK